MEKFRSGDLVRFKNGACLMVVVAVGPKGIDCALLPRTEREPLITVDEDVLEGNRHVAQQSAVVAPIQRP